MACYLALRHRTKHPRALRSTDVGLKLIWFEEVLPFNERQDVGRPTPHAVVKSVNRFGRCVIALGPIVHPVKGNNPAGKLRCVSW